MHALTVVEAQRLIADGHHEELEQRVFDAYKKLERRFDVMVVEGTDFAGVLPVLDFELNATLANQLGCSVLVTRPASSSRPAPGGWRSTREHPSSASRRVSTAGFAPTTSSRPRGPSGTSFHRWYGAPTRVDG